MTAVVIDLAPYRRRREADDSERWANEVVAIWRSGRSLREAVEAAYEDDAELGDEDAPVNLYEEREEQS